jgi:hypothetical protein
MQNQDTATVIICLKNSTLDDSLLSVEVVKTLREYCDMVDRCEAGNKRQEFFSGPNGTELTVIAVRSPVVCIPQLEPLKLHPQYVAAMTGHK